MKKNDVFYGKCVGYDNDGLGVVKHDGFVVFVKNFIKGEYAEIVCTFVKKNYGYGKIVELIKESENRVNPPCSVYKTCGGCMLQHMNTFEQAFFKKDKVINCFKSIAGMDIEVKDVLMMEDPYRYRNKVQVPVLYDEILKMGFYKNRTNEIVEFEDCLVQSELSNDILRYLKKELLNYTFKADIRHILIKHSRKLNEVMIVIISGKELKNYERLINKIIDNFKEVKSIICNVNERKDNVILGEKEILLYGDRYIKEELCKMRFNISCKSFFQINPYQAEILYDKAISLADINSNDVVLDLYCGTGTIGIIASRYAKKVIGIEIVEDAIKDAKVNAINNKIDNIEFYCMNAGEGANKLIEEGIKIDVVIVDPPRKGLDDLAITSIIKIDPKRLVYVSCDPATLARDCKIFKECGYEIKEIQPIDMFPKTDHVETVCLLSRNV